MLTTFLQVSHNMYTTASKQRIQDLEQLSTSFLLLQLRHPDEVFGDTEIKITQQGGRHVHEESSCQCGDRSRCDAREEHRRYL